MALIAMLVLPVLVGTALVRASGITDRQDGAAWLLQLSLGAATGASVLSLLYFLDRFFLPGSMGGQWLIELGMAAGAGVLLWRSQPRFGPSASPLTPLAYGIGTVFAILLAAQAIQFVRVSEGIPYGEWDAWAIWNLRAKFLAAPDDAWRTAFSPLLGSLPGEAGTHYDYPLLLSSFIARGWVMERASGGPAAPMLAAGLFSLACVGLVTGGLAMTRGWGLGLAGGVILLANAAFNAQAPTQYSDVPLGCYIVAAFVMLDRAAEHGSAGTWALTGFLAGSAAWCKDEGLVLAAGMLGLLGLSAALRRLPWSSFGWFCGGAAGPVAATLALKLVLVGGPGSWAGLTLSEAIGKATQVERYERIFSAFMAGLGEMGPGAAHPAVLVVILWAALGIRLKPWRSLPQAVPVLAWSGLAMSYVLVYAVTPFDLEWHLRTSASRLLVQLTPAATFLAVWICGTSPKAVEAPKRRSGN